jgi:hypothetical protein
MTKRTIGTCSLCGGAVTVPTVWLGTVSPVPQCETCHATPKKPHGPVIEMAPPERNWRALPYAPLPDDGYIPNDFGV